MPEALRHRLLVGAAALPFCVWPVGTAVLWRQLLTLSGLLLVFFPPPLLLLLLLTLSFARKESRGEVFQAG